MSPNLKRIERYALLRGQDCNWLIGLSRLDGTSPMMLFWWNGSLLWFETSILDLYIYIYIYIMKYFAVTLASLLAASDAFTAHNFKVRIWWWMYLFDLMVGYWIDDTWHDGIEEAGAGNVIKIMIYVMAASFLRIKNWSIKETTRFWIHWWKFEKDTTRNVWHFLPYYLFEIKSTS